MYLVDFGQAARIGLPHSNALLRCLTWTVGVCWTPPWQCFTSLFTLDGRRDMSLQKISANTRLGLVNVKRWFAVPRYNFFIDTLTPLTLFDVVVLSHALHWRGRWQKNNYDCLIYGDQQGARPQPHYERAVVACVP